LAGDTSVTIHAFEKTSNEMAENWKIIYEYLLSSFEDEALIMLGSVKELTENMLDISIKLKQETKLAADKVKDIINAARKHKQEDINNINNINNHKKKEAAEEKLGKLETELEVITKNVEKAEKSAYRWGLVNNIVPFPIKSYQDAQELADSKRKG
jgi:NADH dehydrogenase/NADH:ubiquinone oxidoreductase subunit G